MPAPSRWVVGPAPDAGAACPKLCGLGPSTLQGTLICLKRGKKKVRNKACRKRIPGGDPARLARFTGRFTGMVIPGTDITVRHAGTGQGAVYEVIAADRSKAISAGRALFRD